MYSLLQMRFVHLRNREQNIQCIQSHAPFLIFWFMTNDLLPPMNKGSSFTIQAVHTTGSNHHTIVLFGLTTHPQWLTASNTVRYNYTPQSLKFALTVVPATIQHLVKWARYHSRQTQYCTSRNHLIWWNNTCDVIN